MHYPLRWTPELKETYGMYWENRTLQMFFEENRSKYPQRVAMVDGDARITYQQLASHVDSVTSGLMDLGIEAGDAVAFQLPNWWEAAVLHLALVRLGAVSVPIVPIYRERELSFILSDAEVKAILVPCTWRAWDYTEMVKRALQPTLQHTLTCRGHAPSCTAFEDLLAARPRAISGPAPDPNALSLLLYTSGTTAEPKGVEHTQNTLMFECRSTIERDHLTPDDVVLMASPCTHIAGLIYGLEMPFVLGSKLVLMDTWDAQQAIRLIERERVTWTLAATPFLQDIVYCEAHSEHDLSSLRLFGCGGASMSPKLLRDAAAAGISAGRAYGSSEHPTISGLGGDSLEKSVEFDGRVHDHIQIKIEALNDPKRSARRREVGEVCTKGPDLFIGYHRPELNECAFDTDGWFHTGDLGWLDEENYIQIVGRIKDIIIRKGEKFSAKEIEDLIFDHPAVWECAVIGLPDEQRGERVCAVVVLKEGCTLTLAELQAFLAKSGIARQKFPEQLEIVSALPKNASGKIRKFELRDRLGVQSVRF